jgi:hypothetical protein
VKRVGAILGFGLAAIAVASAANANENSIDCVEIKIATLSQSEAGQKQLASVTPLDLGDQCQKENNWTQRKAIAGTLYAGSKMYSQKVEEDWLTTGYPKDLPIRMYKRISLRTLIGLVSTNGKSTAFDQALAQELAVTDSKLNTDGSVDKLSLAKSHALGEKLGGYLGGLFFREELQRYFDDPAYQSPDFIELFTLIVPNSGAFLEQLK